MTNDMQRSETNKSDKPILVYFQPKYEDSLPEFVLTHQREHVKCLSEFFCVTVITEDCDYRQVCDKHKPDLVLFETGVNILTCRTPKITNVRACPGIPKVGLINADAWCETRTGTLSELEHWGIETVFSIAITAAEHTPELADNLFIWPNCVDPDVYKDYQEHKLIPVLLSGATAALYPWRQRVHELLAAGYPSLSCPHPGYLARPAAGSSMYGERYARTLNGSWIAPVCGTVAKELVRKHFEIPACRTLMVTEKSPALREAGFIDMHNCVFADENDVLDKVAYLFQHPDELAAISSAGHDLVHSRHTMKQRDQLFQWYKLRQTLQANQRIVQPSVFGPLTVVSSSSHLETNHIISNGLHLSLLRQGDDRLWLGRYEEAKAAYSACLGYMRRFPEARLKSALCNLYQGNAELALSTTFELVQYALDEYKAPDPDPVEWAYYIVALLGSGRVREACKRATQFPLLRHTELSRVRWVVHVLQDRGHDTRSTPDDEGQQSRRSIHRFPKRMMEEWIAEIDKMLVACGQSQLATKLAAVSPNAAGSGHDEHQTIGRMPAFKSRKGECDALVTDISSASHERVAFDAFRYRLACYKVRRRIRAECSLVLRRLQAKCERFLSFTGHRTQDTEFSRAIAELIRKEKLNKAVIVGSAPQMSSVASVVISTIESRRASSVVSVGASLRAHSRGLGRGLDDAGAPRFQSGTSWSFVGDMFEEHNDAYTSVRAREQENGVDMLLIHASELRVPSVDLTEIIRVTRFVALEDTSSMCGRELYGYLLRNHDFVLIVKKTSIHSSYAIFRNKVMCDTELPDFVSRHSMAREPDSGVEIECDVANRGSNPASGVLHATTSGAWSEDDNGGAGIVEGKRS